jgi:hypothetical protein
MKVRSRFAGKCSPVHFWWGAMDLAYTRFSGRPAPPHPGGIPNLPDQVTREAYSHECMSVGWWPGNLGSSVADPAFYAYGYPEPPGFSTSRVGPRDARYDSALREWVLPYEAVRQSLDPVAAVVEFAESSFEAVRELGHWDEVPSSR